MAFLEKMLEYRIIGEDDPVELIEGELIAVSPQGPYHTTVTDNVADRLRAALDGGWCIREDKPVVAGSHSLPEPDLAVVQGPRVRWRQRHPRGDECLLLIEVALTSQELDRGKAAVYALSGVPVYWIIDLESRVLVVHEFPSPTGYGRRTELATSETVAVPGCAFPWSVADLFV